MIQMQLNAVLFSLFALLWHTESVQIPPQVQFHSRSDDLRAEKINE